MGDSRNGTSAKRVEDVLPQDTINELTEYGFVVVRDSSGLLNHGDELARNGWGRFYGETVDVWRRVEVDPT